VVANEDARWRRRRRRWRRPTAARRAERQGRRQAPGLQAPVVCRPFLLPLPHQTRAKRQRASASHPLRFARYAFYVPVVVSKIISEILAPLLAALSLLLSFSSAVQETNRRAPLRKFMFACTRHQRFFRLLFVCAPPHVRHITLCLASMAFRHTTQQKNGFCHAFGEKLLLIFINKRRCGRSVGLVWQQKKVVRIWAH
jgi:hypothetical protein